MLAGGHLLVGPAGAWSRGGGDGVESDKPIADRLSQHHAHDGAALATGRRRRASLGHAFEHLANMPRAYLGHLEGTENRVGVLPEQLLIALGRRRSQPARRQPARDDIL